MLPIRKLDQTIRDAQSAREDSHALWREVAIKTKKGSDDDSPPQDSDPAEKIRLNLAGRYRVGDGNEFACEIREISPAGLHIAGPKEGCLGDWCTANIASVGIVEGIVVQTGRESLTVGIIALPSRIHRLGRRLRWQLRRDAEDLADRRSSERIEMDHAKATLETSEGRVFSCEVFDISEGGAALHLGADALYFWANQPIKMDERPGYVLRHFPGGLVIKFD